jgi:hypothetical protein
MNYFDMLYLYLFKYTYTYLNFNLLSTCLKIKIFLIITQNLLQLLFILINTIKIQKSKKIKSFKSFKCLYQYSNYYMKELKIQLFSIICNSQKNIILFIQNEIY